MAFWRLASWITARLNESMLPLSHESTVVVGVALVEVLVLVEVVVVATEDELDWVVCVLVLCVEDLCDVGEGVGVGVGEGVEVGCWCVVDVGFWGVVVWLGAAPPPKFQPP